MEADRTYTTFVGGERIVTGDLAEMLRLTKGRHDAEPNEPLQIFDDATGREVDFDFRGSAEEVLERYLSSAPERGPGRPRLGVVAREVTLLPRHWEWLADQPSGASATLRRLVEEARRSEGSEVRARRSAAAAGRAMTALAGNRPHFEEAYRALDAGERQRFLRLTEEWPGDMREYLLRLAEEAFAASSDQIA